MRSRSDAGHHGSSHTIPETRPTPQSRLRRDMAWGLTLAVFAGVGCRAGDANFPTALAGGHRESLAALSASQSVVWVNQVNATVSGTTITKTSGEPFMEDAGAASQQSIASGDGVFQFTVDEVNNFRFVGFGHTPTWQGAANIDFSFRLQGGHADVYENGLYITDILVAAGDVLRIDVVGGVGRFYVGSVWRLDHAGARGGRRSHAGWQRCSHRRRPPPYVHRSDDQRGIRLVARLDVSAAARGSRSSRMPSRVGRTSITR